MAGDCHMGYAGQHVMFVVLYAGIFHWFCNASVNVPHALRCLMAVGMAGSGMYHVVTGAVCSSKSATAVMHAHWDTLPLFRIRLIQLTVFFQCSLAPIASHVSHKAGGATRVPKLAMMNGLALAHASAMCWWWMCESTIALHALALVFLFFGVASLTFVFSATKSRLLFYFYIFVLGPIPAVVLNLLSTAFPFDLDGRLMPFTPADEFDPHPAVVLYAFVYDTRIAALNMGICHVVIAQIAAESRDATPSASPDRGLPRPVASGRHLLPRLWNSSARTRPTLCGTLGSEWSLLSAGLVVFVIVMAYIVMGVCCRQVSLSLRSSARGGCSTPGLKKGAQSCQLIIRANLVESSFPLRIGPMCRGVRSARRACWSR